MERIDDAGLDLPLERVFDELMDGDIIVFQRADEPGARDAPQVPTCRGYLYKRTHCGLIKGWRKRWFVLATDGCLYYYRHKRVSYLLTSITVTTLVVEGNIYSSAVL